MEFDIVDVFATRKYTGNQLAVVHGFDALSDDEMHEIAREFDYSETTFVESTEPPYDVRIFTPREEVDFAGHPTLGTASVILDRYESDHGVTLNLGVGEIDVWRDDVLWMRQKPPRFGREFDAGEVASVLGLSQDDIDARYPVQEVSTGLPAVIVPVESLDAVRTAEIDLGVYRRRVRDWDARVYHVFTPETYGEGDLNTRMFAPYYGVPEDPATGSANGCLAGYLVEHDYFGGDELDLTVEQGYEIERPSNLYLRAGGGGEIQVEVGGEVMKVAEGELV